MFQKIFIDKIETNILCSVTFLENRAVYEKVVQNIVESDRPQMTIWCMLQTHTHRM